MSEYYDIHWNLPISSYGLPRSGLSVKKDKKLLIKNIKSLIHTRPDISNDFVSFEIISFPGEGMRAMKKKFINFRVPEDRRRIHSAVRYRRKIQPGRQLQVVLQLLLLQAEEPGCLQQAQFPGRAHPAGS